MRATEAPARTARISIVVGATVLLAACGGGGGGTPGGGSPVPNPPPSPPPEPPPSAVQFTLGGVVAGLLGSGLTLRNAGTDLTISADGSFSFPDALPNGTAYDVTVAAHPDDPLQVCSVSNGSGTISDAHVTDVAIDCASTYQFLSSMPADGMAEVTRAVEPRLTFSALLDPATATSDNVSLSSDAGSVTIAVNAAGSELTIVPHAPLLPLTLYAVSVSTGLLSDAADVLPEPVATTFTTRDASWLPQESIADLPGGGSGAEVAVDAEGNALALWVQEMAGGRAELWARYRDAEGNDWSTPTPVDTSDYEFAGGAQVEFTGADAAIAVWYRREEFGDDLELWTNRYERLAGWGVAERIDTGGVVVEAFRLAGNGLGALMMVWHQYEGSTARLLASRYASPTGWGSPELVDAIDGAVGAADLALDPDGNAIVVWDRPANAVVTLTDTFAIAYQQGAGWGPSERISTNNVGNTSASRVAMDEAGNAMAVWRGNNGFDPRIYAGRYTKGAGWEAPDLVDSVIGDTDYPRIAVHSSGAAIAVWQQYVAGNSFAYANRFVPGTGWGAAEQISASGSGAVLSSRVAFDPSGNALAGWQQLGPVLPPDYSVWSNRYTPAGGWSVAEQVSVPAGRIETFKPSLAIDARGNALAIWSQSDAGITRVWVSRFE